MTEKELRKTVIEKVLKLSENDASKVLIFALGLEVGKSSISNEKENSKD